MNDRKYKFRTQKQSRRIAAAFASCFLLVLTAVTGGIFAFIDRGYGDDLGASGEFALLNHNGQIDLRALPEQIRTMIGDTNSTLTGADFVGTPFVRLFEDAGAGNTLALSRLMWQPVYFNDGILTLWATSHYFSSAIGGGAGTAFVNGTETQARVQMQNHFNDLQKQIGFSRDAFVLPSQISWQSSQPNSMATNNLIYFNASLSAMNNENDFLFIPSVFEILNTTTTAPTNTARGGLWQLNNLDRGRSSIAPWTRSAQLIQPSAGAVVQGNGFANVISGSFLTTSFAIRPAIHLDLMAILYQSRFNSNSYLFEIDEFQNKFVLIDREVGEFTSPYTIANNRIPNPHYRIERVRTYANPSAEYGDYDYGVYTYEYERVRDEYLDSRGIRFVGWATSQANAVNGVVAHAPTADITLANSDANRSFYAVYEFYPARTLTINLGDEFWGDDRVVVRNFVRPGIYVAPGTTNPFPLAFDREPNTAVRTHVGWATSRENARLGIVEWQTNDNMFEQPPLHEDTAIYAVWRRISDAWLYIHVGGEYDEYDDWQPAPPIAITYAQRSVDLGDFVPPVRTGYIFAGWNTNNVLASDGIMQFSPNAVISFPIVNINETNLFPVWRPLRLTIDFNSVIYAGITSPVHSVDYPTEVELQGVAGRNIGSTLNRAPFVFAFVGLATSAAQAATGVADVEWGAPFMIGDEITLHAVWQIFETGTRPGPEDIPPITDDNEHLPALPTPSAPNLSDMVFSWIGTAGAQAYRVYINGHPVVLVAPTLTAIDLGMFAIPQGEFVVTVRAIGNGVTNRHSGMSAGAFFIIDSENENPGGEELPIDDEDLRDWSDEYVSEDEVEIINPEDIPVISPSPSPSPSPTPTPEPSPTPTPTPPADTTTPDETPVETTPVEPSPTLPAETSPPADTTTPDESSPSSTPPVESTPPTDSDNNRPPVGGGNNGGGNENSSENNNDNSNNIVINVPSGAISERMMVLAMVFMLSVVAIVVVAITLGRRRKGE